MRMTQPSRGERDIRLGPADIEAANLPHGTSEIAGLLPDGVNNVIFTLADGSRRQAPVISNGVALTVPSPPESASFRGRHNVLHEGRM